MDPGAGGPPCWNDIHLMTARGAVDGREREGERESVCVCVSECVGETERQRYRETDRQRERERDTHTHRERETHTHREKESRRVQAFVSGV